MTLTAKQVDSTHYAQAKLSPVTVW